MKLLIVNNTINENMQLIFEILFMENVVHHLLLYIIQIDIILEK